MAAFRTARCFAATRSRSNACLQPSAAILRPASSANSVLARRFSRFQARTFKTNATHEDILFAPHKTPEINLSNVWMHKDNREVLLIKNYEPTEFVKKAAM